MSLYSNTSIKEVIGRVIRNTRIQDSSYLKDCNEWIPEAMGQMKTKVSLESKWCFIDIEFYKGKLPCGIVKLLGAVDMNGQRMSRYNGMEPVGIPFPSRGQLAIARDSNTPAPTGDSSFLTNIVSRETFEDSITFETILTQINTAEASQHRYYTELGWLNVDYADGRALIVYNRIPLDADNLPLIPDEENYKEALYWYVRGKMIGAGFIDRAINMEGCETRFEKFAARAMATIRYSSVDQKQHAMETLNTLIFPDNAWDGLFGDI